MGGWWRKIKVFLLANRRKQRKRQEKVLNRKNCIYVGGCCFKFDLGIKIRALSL